MGPKTRRVRRAAAAAVGVLAAGLQAGCGGTPAVDGARGAPGGAVAERPHLTDGGEAVVSCGGRPGWPVSAMEADFFVLLDDGDRVVLATGGWTTDGPGQDGQVVTLTRGEGAGGRTDGLGFATAGDCRLAPLLPEGEGWAEVRAARTGEGGLVLELAELECTSGRDPSAHLRDPVVVETDESVTVLATSQAPVGAQSCPGNPSTERVVALAAPLGDRELLDGSVWPPAPVGMTGAR